MARRAAVYLRISKDDLGTGLGIERQRHAVKALASAKGWRIDPGWVIEENDVSASKKRARPGFERLLAGMASGEVEAVVAYAVDRLVRRLDDLTRLIETAEEFGVPVATVAGDIDLSTGHGRGLAKLLGVVASIETDNMGERMRQRKRQNAQAGKVWSSGRRPYGFATNRRDVIDAEAKVIQEAADRILAGESLTRIVADMNRRGVPTAYGSAWTLPRLQRTLSRPALCGRVVYRGTLLRDNDGTPVRGEWQPILTEDEFDQLQVAVAARRRHPAEWTQQRRHLLSGISRCGLCGAKMLGFRQSNGRWTYLCGARRHLSRQKQQVEDTVIAKVKAKAAETVFPVTGWTDEQGQEVRRQIAALEHRKHDAAREFADGSLPADVLRMIVNDLDQRIDDLRDRLVGHAVDVQNIDAATLDLDDLFAEQATAEGDLLERQRAAIAVYVRRIVVHPAGRGMRFDPDLIEIDWRDLSTTALRGIAETS